MELSGGNEGGNKSRRIEREGESNMGGFAQCTLVWRCPYVIKLCRIAIYSEN